MAQSEKSSDIDQLKTISKVVLRPRISTIATTPPELPAQVKHYPEFRYMGSKKRLLPWIHRVLDTLDFESALDPFSGAGCVSYLMKATGRRVIASDFLKFSSLIARATIENSSRHLDGKAIQRLMDPKPATERFIEKTFSGVFYAPEDLQFLDRVSRNILCLEHPAEQALAYAALFRS